MRTLSGLKLPRFRQVSNILTIYVLAWILGMAAAKAQTMPESEIPEGVLMVPEANFKDGVKPLDPASMPEELTVVVPNDVDPSKVTNDEARKAQLLADLQAGIGRAQANADGVIIPVSPDSEAELAELRQATSSEIELFLTKKEKFLNKFAAILKKIRLSPAKISKGVTLMNAKFYESARLIARSNSYGGSAMLTISGGLAFPRKMLERLRATRMAHYISESGGFYYTLGLGAGISYGERADGRKTMSLEIFVDTETLKKAITGIVEVSLAGNYALVYERRDGRFASQTMTTSYGGALGVIRSGPNQFSWAASTGLSMPPFVGAILVYQNTTTRHYLLRVSRDGITVPALGVVKDFMVQFWSKVLAPARAPVCSKLF